MTVFSTTKPFEYKAGFAPSDDPQVAIVVLVEHGGAGGRNAAPIATRILQEYLAGSVPRAEPAGGAERGGARRTRGRGGR